MTDTKMLERAIKRRGIEKEKIAELMGLTPLMLEKKVDGIVEFKSDEISSICELLRLSCDDSESIFFSTGIVEASPFVFALLAIVSIVIYIFMCWYIRIRARQMSSKRRFKYIHHIFGGYRIRKGIQN